MHNNIRTKTNNTFVELHIDYPDLICFEEIRVILASAFCKQSFFLSEMRNDPGARIILALGPNATVHM